MECERPPWGLECNATVRLQDSAGAFITASIGISIYPEHGSGHDALLSSADVAMYAAKDDHNGAVIYSSDRDHHSTAQLSLVTELRESITAGDLRLAYQPKDFGALGPRSVD